MTAGSAVISVMVVIRAISSPLPSPLSRQAPRLEDVGEFVAWLRLPLPGREGVVAVLPSAVPQVGEATINRKLAAVSAFYAHQARNGADVGDLLATRRAGGRGGWKPFLHHVSKGKPHRGRAIKPSPGCGLSRWVRS